jgi:hypothetical protein
MDWFLLHRLFWVGLNSYTTGTARDDTSSETNGMKFGLRKPSLKKMASARASPKRFARHGLGMKAPPGAGWLTDPKRALYNRVHSRTSFSLTGLFKLLIRSIYGR